MEQSLVLIIFFAIMGVGVCCLCLPSFAFYWRIIHRAPWAFCLSTIPSGSWLCSACFSLSCLTLLGYATMYFFGRVIGSFVNKPPKLLACWKNIPSLLGPGSGGTESSFATLCWMWRREPLYSLLGFYPVYRAGAVHISSNSPLPLLYAISIHLWQPE